MRLTPNILFIPSQIWLVVIAIDIQHYSNILHCNIQSMWHWIFMSNKTLDPICYKVHGLELKEKVLHEKFFFLASKTESSLFWLPFQFLNRTSTYISLKSHFYSKLISIKIMTSKKRLWNVMFTFHNQPLQQKFYYQG